MTVECAGLPRTTGGAWAVSDSRTRVTFRVPHVGHAVHGSVALSWAEVRVDATGAPVGVRAELDLNGLDTGIARRDADLRKPRFLDIDRHPTVSWHADRFTGTDDGRWTAHGELNVRGTSVPLEVTGAPDAVPGADGAVRVRATAALDRSAVGIRAPSLLIGRTVRIAVDAWLVPAVPSP